MSGDDELRRLLRATEAYAEAVEAQALEERRQREALEARVLEERRQREAAQQCTIEVRRLREAVQERFCAAEELPRLTQYILTCHLLDNELKLDHNGPSTDSQTQARYAAGQVCPKQIVPWKDFPNEILAVLDELSLSSIFHEFFSAMVPDEMWWQSVTPVRGESDLIDRQEVLVTDAVNTLLKKSGQDPVLREAFGIAADAKLSFDDFLDGQWCGYETPDMDSPNPILHVMYEAPHRLTPGQLETGLDGENVIELSHVMDKSCQTGDVFLSESRRLAAAAITQLYAAMIQKGVRFGYLDTGEVKVFLRIGHDPSRVEYFLAIPSRDVEVEGDAEPRLHLTSVAQVFAFTILALQSPDTDEAWVHASLALGTWDVACDVVLAEMPEMDRQKPCHKAHEPKKENEFYRHSPFPTRAKDFQSMDDHPYCTHECLRGLTFGGSLDEKCPNAKDHGTEHIGREEFLRLIGKQLEAYPRISAECYPLNSSGSVGSLFKIRLLSHGYTLVAKAVNRYDQDTMYYEEKMYNILRDLQGDYIPVCPGHVVLSRGMYCSHYEWSYFLHFLLLSYGGRPVLHALPKVEEAITNQILTALGQLHKYRVLHHDAEPRNILYDERTGKCMVVDLERSESCTETETQSHDLVSKRDDVHFAAEAKSLLASLTSVKAC
ncbi:hypothetical protein E4U40_006054 [Claviceps sp. LM458 group G5]|nr:hypothetical protein E4U40_006054 [Claviceps sp. LM458 group G5]